jgi:hypothetical protein
MRFMITFSHVAGAWDRLSPEEHEAHGRWLARFTAELRQEKGATLVFLATADQRRIARKHESGEIEVSQGPAIPGPEQVGGYYIIDAESIEEAVVWARKGRWLVGSNEVRQLYGEAA